MKDMHRSPPRQRREGKMQIFVGDAAPRNAQQAELMFKIEIGLAQVGRRMKYSARRPTKQIRDLMWRIVSLAIIRSEPSAYDDKSSVGNSVLGYETKMTLDGKAEVPTFLLRISSPATQHEVSRLCTVLDPHLLKAMRADWYHSFYKYLLLMTTMSPQQLEECLEAVDSTDWARAS